MSTTLTVTEARATLPDVIERVLAGEEVTLTRHGQPVAVVVRPDALRSRRAEHALAAADRLHEMLESSRVSPLRERPRVRPELADEIVSSVRAGRSRR